MVRVIIVCVGRSVHCADLDGFVIVDSYTKRLCSE